MTPPTRSPPLKLVTWLDILLGDIFLPLPGLSLAWSPLLGADSFPLVRSSLTDSLMDSTSTSSHRNNKIYLSNVTMCNPTCIIY